MRSLKTKIKSTWKRMKKYCLQQGLMACIILLTSSKSEDKTIVCADFTVHHCRC